MSKIKVGIVGTAGLPPNYGGFETLVNHITKADQNNYIYYVFCPKTSTQSRLDSYNNANLIYLPLKANGPQSILYDIISIVISWLKYDVTLILGTAGTLILPILNRIKSKKTVVNFGGLEWQRDKWNIIGKMYLKFSEKIAVKHSSIVVADNQHFVDYIKYNYGVESQLIEYGGDHAIKVKKTNDDLEKYPFLRNPYFISVSRAQVDNNLHLLLNVFSKLSELNLVLISNWDVSDYGKRLKNKYNNFTNIFLLDAIYSQISLDLLRSNALAYIHTHTYCGSAPSLIEAMNLNLGIISFFTKTNVFTTENKAMFFNDEKTLYDILNEIKETDYKNNGHLMKKIAKERYNWNVITNKYHKTFN
jgi:hypothetical protein